MEKLNLSVILPIKSSLVRDFDEYFKKSIRDSIQGHKEEYECSMDVIYKEV